MPMSAPGGAPPPLHLLDYCEDLPEEERPRIVSFREIAAALDLIVGRPALESQARAYRARPEQVSLCPVQTVGQPPLLPVPAGPEAQTCIKTGYIGGDDVFVTKVAGGGGRYAGNTGLMLVFSQRTLRLRAVLQDEGVLTELRTAAAAAFASSLFAPREVSLLGMVGASVQALWQLRLLTYVTPCRKVLLLSRSRASAEKFREQLRASACPLDREWDVELAEGPADFSRCQLIHTCTTSRSPILGPGDVGAAGGGVHITAIGADAPGKKELHPALVARADLRVCDSLEQSRSRGEFQGFDGEIIEISTVLNAPDVEKARHTRGDGADRRLTIFDSSGVATQDVAIAKLLADAVAARPAASKL